MALVVDRSASYRAPSNDGATYAFGILDAPRAMPVTLKR